MNYDDIIHLPHYEPKHHSRMPMADRAAQFAPFAAVAGHYAAISEEARITDSWTDLGDFGKEVLDRKMEQLLSRLSEQPTVTIEYFIPDSHKAGGSYQTVTSRVKRFDEYERTLELTDGRKIAIDTISDINIAE